MRTSYRLGAFVITGAGAGPAFAAAASAPQPATSTPGENPITPGGAPTWMVPAPAGLAFGLLAGLLVGWVVARHARGWHAWGVPVAPDAPVR